MTTTEPAADDRPGPPAPAGGPEAPDDRRRFTIGLVVLTAVGLAIRLAYVVFVWKDRELVGDPVFYHEAANLLADGHGFISPAHFQEGLLVPSADHPPLYTLYLGLWSSLGVRSVLGHMVVSCLLGAASVYLSGLLGRRVAGPRAGLLAAGLVAVYPNTWRFDGMVLSESMVILVVAATLLAAYRYWERPGVGRLAVVSVGVALCALARSELLLLSLVLVVPLALLRRERPLRQRVAWIAVAAAACTLTLAPWMLHNLARFERPVLLSGQLEVTLTVANCDGAYYGDFTGYWDYGCGGRILERRGIDPTVSDGTVQDALLEETLEYMRAEAGRMPVVIGVRVARIFNLWDPVNAVNIDSMVERNPTPVAWASLVAFWPMAAAAAAGAVVLRRRGTLMFPLLSPLMVVLITVVLFYASTRFRAATEGALCVLAAVALDALWRRWAPAGRPSGEPREEGSAVGVGPS